MQLRTTLSLILSLLILGLAACYESPDVTVHQPGVYKGDKDPLLEKQRTSDQQQRLRERFNLVQTDR